MVTLTLLYTFCVALSVVPGGSASLERRGHHDHRRHWKRIQQHHQQPQNEARDAWSTAWSTTWGAGDSIPTDVLSHLGAQLGNGKGGSWSTTWSWSWNSNGQPTGDAPPPPAPTPDGGNGGDGGWTSSWTSSWSSQPTPDNLNGGDSPYRGAMSLDPAHGDFVHTWSSTWGGDAPQPTPTGPYADQQQWLDSHNNVRSKYGAGNLQWNNTLATAAQNWSNQCNFKHSQGSMGPYGENLAAGTGDYQIHMAANDWANESGQYNPNDPQYSHFTQMVWKDTTQIGCAVAECQGIFDSNYGPAKFYTCEYYPQGNVIGQFRANVQV